MEAEPRPYSYVMRCGTSPSRLCDVSCRGPALNPVTFHCLTDTKWVNLFLFDLIALERISSPSLNKNQKPPPAEVGPSLKSEPRFKSDEEKLQVQLKQSDNVFIPVSGTLKGFPGGIQKPCFFFQFVVSYISVMIF